MLRSALEGITVIDFTQIGAGPTCTMLLADMGARVIKVESPAGDMARGMGPGRIGDDGALYHAFNRNKLGVCLDLKTPDGRAAAQKLAEGADVVVESMRPGVMRRLGLGYEDLSSEHASLVYCSISAYGQKGPYADQAGVDGILQAESGLMSLIGLPGSEPCKVQAPVVDIVTGYIACMSIVASLYRGQRDGVGEHVDASLLASALSLQQSSLTSYFANRVAPEPMGSAAPYSAPNQAFQTSDGWIMVAAYMPDRWERFCAVLGVPELARDRQFAASQARVKHRSELVALITDVTRTKSTSEWLAALKAQDIPCARVAKYDDLDGHPQIASNGLFVNVAHPEYGPIRMPGFPVNSASLNAWGFKPAPHRGQDTKAVLLSVGFSEEDVQRFESSGAAFCHREQTEPTGSYA
ncbi:CaiB/BaiF CoA transferase family protein [Caballeronia cordobensis]|uniref:CaiB/BaiF CoA transferase family protein n=1 Tax=Caballeronia cordobensis TaxID=1353886 RepID=UPI00045EDF63|nr:uncharacterized protein BRPE67_ECDS02940 [Burkholderia sp. RPE67]